MSELAIRTETRLEELASLANTKLEDFMGSLRTTLELADEIGSALNEAHSLVSYGDWRQWLETNFNGSSTTANLFRRINMYRASLPSHVTSIAQAKNALEDLSIRLPRKALIDVSGARELRKQGLSYKKVADQLGCDYASVWAALNPQKSKENRDRAYRRNRKASVELRRKERDAAARKVGGDISKAYSLLRQLALVLEDATAKAENPQAREEVKSALNSLYRAEDSISRAIRGWNA